MLEELKQQVVTYAKKADAAGLCKNKSGNVSVLDPESAYVLITPSGVSREVLTPDMVSVVDFDLNVIEGGKPSSETLMHIECYKARPDIRAIVHSHPKMASAFAVYTIIPTCRKNYTSIFCIRMFYINAITGKFTPNGNTWFM